MSGYVIQSLNRVGEYQLKADAVNSTIELRNAADTDYVGLEINSVYTTGLIWGAPGSSSTFFPLTGANGDLAVSSSLPLAAPRYIIGINNINLGAAPLSLSLRNVGDIWYETSGSNLKYGWPWIWDGTYWRSPDFTFTLSIRNVSSYQVQYLHADPNLDYYFKEVRSTLISNTLQNGTNYWSINLGRLNTSNSESIIGTYNLSQAANSYTARTTSPNTHVDVSAVDAKNFFADVRVNGSPGTLTGAVEVVYQFARP